MTLTVPIILFAYCRPGHLRRSLASLRENQVPLIYAFSDGPGTPDKEPAVAQVREILRSNYWCHVILLERKENLGLGKSILAGVTAVLRDHEACIVFEDDLVCVRGAYEYMVAALIRYMNDPRVMSVTGWTHPGLTPSGITDKPYFDGRAECWVWGTWARAWRGMDRDARTLMQECQRRDIDIFRYGADLPAMAEVEHEKNIWAVRFLYWHILNHGLCLRPPVSLVEHIGFDIQATNTSDGSRLANPPLKGCPPIPVQWPEPVEHSACAEIHQKFWGERPKTPHRLARFVRRIGSKAWHMTFSK